METKRIKDYYANNKIENMVNLTQTIMASFPWNEEDRIGAIELLDFYGEVIYSLKNEYYEEILFEFIGQVMGRFDCPESVDKLIRKMKSSQITDWEVAETLLAISYTEDKRYINLMKEYQNHDDEYVRYVVKEYFYDLEIANKAPEL